MMSETKVSLYGTRFCPYCIAARRLLKQQGVAFDDIGVDGNNALRREVMQKSGRHTVPQIWFGNHHVGGYDDLYSVVKSGRLQELLQ